MADSNWRSNLDILIDKNLDELINETLEFNSAISIAKDKSKAQIWVAMAILNSKLNKILLEKGNADKPRLEKKEVDEILRKLEKL